MLARELEGADDPLTIYERNLGKAREAALAEIARSVKMPNLIANAMPRNPLDTMDPLQTILHGLRSLCVTDTQISTNAAIVDRRYQVMEDSFNFRDRVYTPPPEEDTAIFKVRTPTGDEAEDDFTDWYFSFSDRVGVHDSAGSAISTQNFFDMSRLALAVEIRKRATGSYPDSLDAVAASFPGGLPHDIATGQSYHFEKTPDGFFRIWGTGIDRIDNGGDPRKNTLLKLPLPRQSSPPP